MIRKLLVATAGAITLAAFSIAPGAADADRAKLLLDKHRSYVGWQFGDGTFRTMQIAGTVTDAKGDRTQAISLVFAGLAFQESRTLLKRDNETFHSGFTGRLFWRSDIDGFTTPVYGNYAKYLASLTVLRQEGTTELPGTFLKTAEVDGKAVDVVRVTMQKSDPIDLYVDPQTGAYLQATIDPDGAYQTTYHILSYREVLPGKKMIASYRIDDEKDVHAFTDFKPNVVIDDGQLHPPVATADWTFADTSPGSLKLTNNRVLIDATVNGVQGRFILDTGADGIVLDDGFADRAKLPILKGNTDAFTFYGDVKTRVRRADTITIGGATLNNALVYSQNFRRDDGRGLDRQGYAGLMGFDLFAGAIVKLDIYDSKVQVLDSTTDLSNAPGIPILVDISSGQPVIPMTLDKTVEVNALLDTGNPRGILFGPDLINKEHLRMFAGCGNFDSLAIGPIVYQGEGACQWGMGANYALLGYDFLKHFDITFDYPHGRIFLNPNKN